MEMWLVRHGQTNWNVEGRWQGQTPAAPPLNATGLAQAEALAAQLDGAQFAALYSSDLTRARQTAEIIARRAGLPVAFDARLREVALGDWEGLLGSDVAARYSRELEERRRDPVRSRPPNGETVEELATRLSAALGEIAARHAGAPRVLVVTHGLAMATTLCLARDLPLHQVFDHLPENAQPAIVRWPPEGATDFTDSGSNQ